jgi:hypothetical protein
LGDVLARQQIVFGVDAEMPQVKISGDVKNDQRDPADQSDRRQHRAANQHESGIRSEWRRRQGNGERGEEKGKPRRIFCRCDRTAKVGPAIAKDPPERGKHDRMDNPGKGASAPTSSKPDTIQDGAKESTALGSSSLD